MSKLSADVNALVVERVQWLDEEMEGALQSGSADLALYQWARYHLGWCDARRNPLSDPDRRRFGGKRLRGVLTILAAEACGGDGRSAAAAGAAVELIHNFSLVHDDVEDNDAERRHRPTVWKLWGVPQAINLGSNMQALVNAAVLRLAARGEPPATVVRLLEVVTGAILQMTEGQYLDMAAEDRAGMDLDDYFRMTGGKTAALVEAALRGGALLGTREEEGVEALAEFGREFGLAFQCRDDYLGIWGEPARTGKPVGSDLARGKRSLPVVHALTAAPAETPAGARLRLALAERDVAVALEVMARLETAAFVAEQVERHTTAALQALDRARPTEPAAGALREIAAYALGRES
jgi:geranylgeranyl diphosphate synthase, type I